MIQGSCRFSPDPSPSVAMGGVWARDYVYVAVVGCTMRTSTTLVIVADLRNFLWSLGLLF